MSKPALFAILCLLAAATLGCSAKVKVESENWDTASEASTGELSRTAVEVDVLESRPATPSPTQPMPKPAIPDAWPKLVIPNEPPSFRPKRCHSERSEESRLDSSSSIDRFESHKEPALKSRQPKTERDSLAVLGTGSPPNLIGPYTSSIRLQRAALRL